MKKDLKFFEAEVIPLRQMLHCATACMTMPEVASVKHAASFISNFLIVSRESQYLVSIANDMGEGIFRQVKIVRFSLRLALKITFLGYALCRRTKLEQRLHRLLRRCAPSSQQEIL